MVFIIRDCMGLFHFSLIREGFLHLLFVIFIFKVGVIGGGIIFSYFFILSFLCLSISL